MPDLFISYSRKDLKFVETIVDALSTDDSHVWFDKRDTPKGEDWQKEIEYGIEEADVFLFMLSPNSATSGKYAISGGFDRTSRVWLWHPDDLIAQTCDHLPRNLTRDEWNIYLEGQSYRAVCSILPIDPEATETPGP